MELGQVPLLPYKQCLVGSDTSGKQLNISVSSGSGLLLDTENQILALEYLLFKHYVRMTKGDNEFIEFWWLDMNDQDYTIDDFKKIILDGNSTPLNEKGIHYNGAFLEGTELKTILYIKNSEIAYDFTSLKVYYNNGTAKTEFTAIDWTTLKSNYYHTYEIAYQ